MFPDQIGHHNIDVFLFYKTVKRCTGRPVFRLKDEKHTVYTDVASDNEHT